VAKKYASSLNLLFVKNSDSNDNCSGGQVKRLS
jgi:hypothetical protein